MVHAYGAHGGIRSRDSDLGFKGLGSRVHRLRVEGLAGQEGGNGSIRLAPWHSAEGIVDCFG